MKPTGPPQSFLIYKEELAKEKLEKKKLVDEYEHKMSELRKELGYLKEQIGAQQEMIKTTINYASKLEEHLKKFDQKIKIDKINVKRSYH